MTDNTDGEENSDTTENLDNTLHGVPIDLTDPDRDYLILNMDDGTSETIEVQPGTVEAVKELAQKWGCTPSEAAQKILREFILTEINKLEKETNNGTYEI